MESTKSSPFFSCQKGYPKSCSEILDNIFSPLCPKGLCPKSCETEIALVS